MINELYDPTKWNQEVLDSLPMNESNSENIIDEMSILSESSDELVFQQNSESSNNDISSSDENSSNVFLSDDQETIVFYGFPISDEKPDESGITATERIPIEETKSTEIISDNPAPITTPSQTIITRFNSLSTNLQSRLNLINATETNSEEFEHQHDLTEKGDENDEIDQESEQTDSDTIINVDYISNDPSDIPLRCTSIYTLLEFEGSKDFIDYMDPFFEILVNLIKQLNDNGNNHGNSHDPESCMQICLFIKEILVHYSKQNNEKFGWNHIINQMDEDLMKMFPLFSELVESVEAM
jgi:hypothetical protein